MLNHPTVNALSLGNINAHAPYRVTTDTEHPYLYYFCTDFGVEYEISIKGNDTFVPSGAFSLDIRNKSNQPSPGDPKFRQTLMAIVEEFFRQNNDVMLYVTETRDDKQASRNRLFVRWFNTYEHSDRYVIKTAEGKMDGQTNFMAIILRRDNPRLQLVFEEFDETIAFLFD